MARGYLDKASHASEAESGMVLEVHSNHVVLTQLLGQLRHALRVTYPMQRCITYGTWDLPISHTKASARGHTTCHGLRSRTHGERRRNPCSGVHVTDACCSPMLAQRAACCSDDGLCRQTRAGVVADAVAIVEAPVVVLAELRRWRSQHIDASNAIPTATTDGSKAAA